MVTMVVFQLEAQQYALDLERVERVIPMVTITPLPDAPHVVMGIISVGEHIIPVLSLRHRFGLAHRDPELSDHFLIADTGKRRVALWIDHICDIVEKPEEKSVAATTILPALKHFTGVTTLADGLVLIHDLRECLMLEEEQQLNQAMQRRPVNAP